jgi:hypothetical protein
MLEVVFEHLERAWHYWRSTRSHKGHINWQKFAGFVRHQLPLPKPRILHHIYRSSENELEIQGWLP